jgi:hypothetical protein
VRRPGGANERRSAYVITFEMPGLRHGCIRGHNISRVGNPDVLHPSFTTPCSSPRTSNKNPLVSFDSATNEVVVDFSGVVDSVPYTSFWGRKLKSTLASAQERVLAFAQRDPAAFKRTYQQQMLPVAWLEPDCSSEMELLDEATRQFVNGTSRLVEVKNAR